MVGNNVLHLIDRDLLRDAYRLTRKQSAPGGDQVPAPQYAAPVEDNLRDRHERVRDKRSGAPPGERVWIEQEGGKKRPRGKACFEDTRVQRAGVRLLEAIFAPDVQAFAHGVRQGHRPQQALHALREQGRTLPINWIVDAEVRGGGDHVAWGLLRECIQQRGKEGGILRLIGKGRHAGVLEAGALTPPAKGTPQGGVATLPTKLQTCR